MQFTESARPLRNLIAMCGPPFILTALCCLLLATEAHADLATDCTLYAAPNGSDSNDGAAPDRPKTFGGAAEASMPGSIICLVGGTYTFTESFYFSRSGSASDWIVYKPYGDSPARIVASTSWDSGPANNEFGLLAFWSGSFWLDGYTEFRDLDLDGQNTASTGFMCTRTHHLRFIGNRIKNMGAAGIGSRFCDYLVSDNNQIWHSGYAQGWGSGISYNSHQRYDNDPGFHSVVVNNIISGMYDGSDHHSDGNGIILDLSNDSYEYDTADTTPVLVANNLVYQNGGTCINTYVVTNAWIVNNTCYKNTLDTSNNFAELAANNSNDIRFINNLVYGWDGVHTTYAQHNQTANITYHNNLYFNGPLGFPAPGGSQFIEADPDFVRPPAVDPTAQGQYHTAVPPDQIGNSLQLLPGSPAIDTGVDPRTVPGATPALVAGLDQYILTDLAGNARPSGVSFDIGAYEQGADSPPAAPAELSAQ